MIDWFLRFLAGCDECGSLWGVKTEDSRTCYPWNGTGEDPNRDRRLCRVCAQAHHEYWDVEWAEFFSSQGYS